MDERQVGGLWCHEVLQKLDAFVDGTLDEAASAAVRAHTAGCDNCARFGGAYGALVQALRGGDGDALGDDRVQRLAQRLASVRS